MASRKALKQRVCDAIDRHEKTILHVGDTILQTPELGFKENKTAGLVADLMDQYRVPYRKQLGMTGVKGWLTANQSGPTVALLGELDALVVSNHPMADKKTGAAHACGHNAQIAALMGAMIGLTQSNVIGELAGNIIFFAVPAEECVEIEYRMDLVQKGKIGFLTGKQELIRQGHFDDIDMSLMIHGHNRIDKGKVIIGKSSNGCIIKLIKYIGKAAHAGSSPHLGINALNAANVALSAIHVQRETFRDPDTVRVHPIITKGGELVNIVPSEVCMETFVRGRTHQAIEDADKKVDRALRAGAMAVGAVADIQTVPGYMPLINDEQLADIFKKNTVSLLGKSAYADTGHGTGSTDMGDISHIMPALHPNIGGAVGTSHGADYDIRDKKLMYVSSAKLLAMTVIDLLYRDASTAKKIMASHKSKFTIKEYLEYQDSVFRREIYDGDQGK